MTSLKMCLLILNVFELLLKRYADQINRANHCLQRIYKSIISHLLTINKVTSYILIYAKPPSFYNGGNS